MSPSRALNGGRRLIAASLLWMTAAATAEAAEIRLDHAWYRVELIVFERPYVAPVPPEPEMAAGSQPPAAPVGEMLVRTEPRRYRRNVLAFDDGADRARFYPLDAATLAAPAVPTVDLAYLATIGIDTGPATRERAASEATDAPAPAAGPEAAPSPPTPAEVLAAAIGRFEDDLLSRCYRWLEPGALALGNEARRIGRAAGYRLLHHGAWIQPVPPREMPEPLLLQIGERQGDVWTIEGTIAVTLARYLHVEARLWHPADGASPTGESDPAAYLELDEARRLRTGELNYLDHPRFGVLLRVDPVELPEDLLAAAAATP